MFKNVKPLKHCLTVAAYVKEALHHAHIQRLAEPARPRKQRNRIIRIVNEIIQQLCFVHITGSRLSE